MRTKKFKIANEEVTIMDILEVLDCAEFEITPGAVSRAVEVIAEKREKERLEKERKEKEEREKEELREREKKVREERERRVRDVLERHAEEKLERERKAREAQEAHEAHVRDVTSMDLPMDWENAFNSDARTQGVHAESIPDALVMSLVTLGRVDVEYISSVTGEDCKTVIEALRGAIYQNPETWGECFYKGWETAEEYLSGNLMRKWKSANSANIEYNGYFQDNLDAIERALPKAVATKDIYVTLGSPWVPADVIDDFITHILNLRAPFKGTMHDELTGTWEIPDKSDYRHYVRAENAYGTVKLPALVILERTLNMKSVAVTDEVTVKFEPGKPPTKKRVINQTETVAAIEKQDKMVKEFQRWVWRDESRKKRLETIFENSFSCVRRRVFDGSFLDFPTMSPEVKLYPYQKNAVARIIFTPNTLLAHDVGAGKTYVMAAAGMELNRMGLSKKNMFVVPNSIIGQWKGIFETMYPTAKILCVEPKGFTPASRRRVLKSIRDGVFDAVLIAYSSFEQIPLSKEYYRKKLMNERDEVAKLVEDKSKATLRLKKKKERIEKQLVELSAEPDGKDGEIFFDELGITRLFVDEAHNFKNVPVDTKADTVLGISGAGSKKCRDMMDKVRAVQKQNGGGGVVFATGTPITNSITDAFVMQSYLQSGELALLDLQSFDSWVGMFAERVTEFEIDVDTSSYRLATRFAKFHNLPELTALLSSVADFHRADLAAEIPDCDRRDALIGRTPEFSEYLQDISRRADEVRSGEVSLKEDNMLKITTDGRKAALDFRLVEPKAEFTYVSKVARCAENVLEIYFKTADKNSAQLVFCDSSTPKNGFNLYDELKRLLVSGGVSEAEIAFIHDAETEKKRGALFAKVRRGEVRVLIGSTFKLGLGVNVQDRLIALHHLDVPWRPADMTQREGRILRQGNLNPHVQIFRYITEGSFDAYSWQLLETKARFIAGLLSGALTARSGSDIDDVVLDYAEVKALAVGNPLVKKRVELANELARYSALQRRLVENRQRLERELAELPAQMQEKTEKIRCCEDDAKFCEENVERLPLLDGFMKKEDGESRKALREEIQKAVLNNRLELRERPLMNYRGFDVILPANMLEEKPFVWLKRSGKYYVELGGTETGNLVRIDNYIDGLDERLIKLKSEMAELVERRSEIRAELDKEESYADLIEECSRKIEAIDKKLGVKKK